VPRWSSGRPRPRAAVPVEPAGIESLPREQALPADRRLPRGRAVAGRALRRVGRDRARPPRSRRRRPRARPRLRRALAARRRARRRRSPRAPAPAARRAWSSSARRCSSTGPRIGWGAAPGRGGASLGDPLWWPALTRYVAEMHAAWLAFVTPGAPSIPSCGSSSRCSPAWLRCTPSAWPRAAAPTVRGPPDPLVFYDTSSYGPPPCACSSEVVGGPSSSSTAPTAPSSSPGELGMPEALDWVPIADGTRAPRRHRSGARMNPGPDFRSAIANPSGPGSGRASASHPSPGFPARAGATCRRPSCRPSSPSSPTAPELWIGPRQARLHPARLRGAALSDEHLTAWLICWMDDHDTGFHDHDISAGAVAVVSGRVREERLTIDGPPRDRSLRGRRELSLLARRHPPRAPRRAAIRRSRCTSTRRRSPAWAPTSSARTACSPVTPCPRARSCGRARSSARASWLHAWRPLRRSTPARPAIRIRLTISGANSPCSTTPGVALKPRRQLARVADRAEVVGDQVAVGALPESAAELAARLRAPWAPAPQPRMARAPLSVRSTPKRSSSSGTGGARARRRPSRPRRSPRSAAPPPRRSSRACAPAAALDQPARSGRSGRRRRSRCRARRPRPGSHVSPSERAARSVAGEVATQRTFRSSRSASAGRADRRRSSRSPARRACRPRPAPRPPLAAARFC
jgi:hypothetical protein